MAPTTSSLPSSSALPPAWLTPSLKNSWFRHVFLPLTGLSTSSSPLHINLVDVSGTGKGGVKKGFWFGLPPVRLGARLAPLRLVNVFLHVVGLSGHRPAGDVVVPLVLVVW